MRTSLDCKEKNRSFMGTNKINGHMEELQMYHTMQQVAHEVE